MQRRLIMLRHGQTVYNATRRMQGHLDTQLSERGLEQARAAAEFVAPLNISKIVASDLSRAADTAAIISDALGLPLTTDPRLRETHLGQWQGKSHDEVDGEHPGARALWRNDATWAPPEGESRVEVARRARPVVDELLAEYDEWRDSAVLLVAHGGTISALTASLLGFDVAQYPLLKSLGNTNTARLYAMPAYDTGAGTAAATDAPAGSASTVQWYLEAWNQGLVVS